MSKETRRLLEQSARAREALKSKPKSDTWALASHVKPSQELVSIMSIPNQQHQNNTPRPQWRAKLYARGINDLVIDRAGIRPDGCGWVYPISPDVTGQRWKAYPGQRGPKYLWKPSHPDNARFYDPAGDLADHVAAAEGVLVLAGGEADVWVLWSAGIYNTTCTLAGEGTIPPWFVDEMHRLKVVTVQAWPDCDNAGLNHARKISQALHGEGIALEVYALPYDLGSKADLNTLWDDQGRERGAFVAALESCAALELPDPVPDPDEQLVRHQPPPQEFADLYERWCVEVVETAAVRLWNIAPPNGEGWSQKNFSSPLRDDRNPSACWSYNAHGFQDFAAGEFVNTQQVAEMVGCQTWATFKLDHAADISKISEPVQAQIIECFIGEDLNYYPDGIPLKLIGLLNGLHNNRWVHIDKGDILNGGSFVALWAAWHELVIAGQQDPLEPFSITSISAATGLSYAAAQNAIDWGYFFEFLSPYIESNNNRGKETQKSLGRPAQKFVFRSLREALLNFIGKLETLLWRALLITKYPDLPVEALAVDDLLIKHGATLDDIAVIDDRSQPLYEDHGDQLYEAQKHLLWRLDEWRDNYIYPEDETPLRLPPGATFSNASQFRDLLNRLDFEQSGGERKDRYKVADLTGRTLAAHRASCKRLDIATIPEYKPYPVRAVKPLVEQAQELSNDAYFRGRIDLYAPDGEKVKVSPGYAKSFDYEDWLTQHGGRDGSRFEVWERSIEKSEKSLTDIERGQRDDASDRQKAICSRRRRNTDPEPTQLEKWLIRQGEIRAGLFALQPVPRENAEIFIAQSGAVFERGDVWKAIISQVRVSEGAEMPTYTVNSLKNDAPDNPDAQRPQGEAVASYIRNRVNWLVGDLGKRTRQLGGVVPHQEAADHRCDCCGQVAEYQTFTGWVCAEHKLVPPAQRAALALDRLGGTILPINPTYQYE